VSGRRGSEDKANLRCWTSIFSPLCSAWLPAHQPRTSTSWQQAPRHRLSNCTPKELTPCKSVGNKDTKSVLYQPDQDISSFVFLQVVSTFLAIEATFTGRAPGLKGVSVFVTPGRCLWRHYFNCLFPLSITPSRNPRWAKVRYPSTYH